MLLIVSIVAMYHVLCIMYGCIKYKSTKYKSTKYKVQSTKYKVQSTKYKVFLASVIKSAIGVWLRVNHLLYIVHNT